MRSSACCEPTVTTTSSGWVWMPTVGRTSDVMSSRSHSSPWPEPYCSARVPRSTSIRATASATASSGSAATYGIPPASETTSGRDATAKSARTSDAVIVRVRAA